MREYKMQVQTVAVLARVVCDGCGRELEPREDFLTIEKTWGYHSHRDGETTRLDLCEACFDERLAPLLPAEKKEPLSEKN